MLRRLAGRRHDVVTAYRVQRGAAVAERAVTTVVNFRLLAPEEIAAYVASGEWRGKAGGYAIQGIAALFATEIRGSITNVVGLPLAEVVADLRAVGGLPNWPPPGFGGNADMTTRAEEIARNLEAVRARIASAERAAGRAAGSARLIAVSKTMPAEDVQAALAHGQRDFGENYAQELRDKRAALLAAITDAAARPRWHYIGPIQSNKVKYLAGQVALVHTVDAPALLPELERRTAGAAGGAGAGLPGAGERRRRGAEAGAGAGGPAGAAGWLRRLPAPALRGPDVDPAADRRSRGGAAALPGAAPAARRAGPREPAQRRAARAVDGHEPRPGGGGRRGRHAGAGGHRHLRRAPEGRRREPADRSRRISCAWRSRRRCAGRGRARAARSGRWWCATARCWRRAATRSPRATIPPPTPRCRPSAAACTQLGSFQLTGCDLYASCEPCPMCLGAIYWARPRAVYYAATREQAAAAGFDDAHIYEELARGPDDRQRQLTRIAAARRGRAVRALAGAGGKDPILRAASYSTTWLPTRAGHAAGARGAARATGAAGAFHHRATGAAGAHHRATGAAGAFHARPRRRCRWGAAGT